MKILLVDDSHAIAGIYLKLPPILGQQLKTIFCA